MAIVRPETNAGGMSALPAGEESCDDAVALGRSKRIALVFGQIRPLKRPFGAVETRGLNGDVATLRLHQDDLTGNTGLSCHHASQIMRISASGLFHRHATTRGFPSVCTRWCVLRSYGPRLCPRLIR